LIYGIFGRNIRQPIGGDFALSARLARHIVSVPWHRTTNEYGVDIFMTMQALLGDFKIGQVGLGSKVHKPSAPKLGPMFLQVVSTALLTVAGNFQKWKSVTDVEDAVSGVRYLAETGRADGTRAVIMGGSAGGYTVLQAMIEEPDVFCAGIDMYGVSDLFHLASDTHKFEARYLDTLIGPLPEAAPLYRERSPVNHAELIRRPLAVFQGDQDQAVPQAQSDRIVEALRRSGTPCVYHVYEGEGHGFRKQETIEHFWAEVDRFLRDHVVYA
jgi:dienelactone hydrolase